MVASVQGLMVNQQVGKQLVDPQDTQTIVKLSLSSATGLVALAGGGLSASTPVCPAYINEFTTVATNNDSCQLPPAIPGLEITVINSGAATLRIYANNDNINNAGAADLIVPEANLPSSTVAFSSLNSAAIGVFSCIRAGYWKSQFQ